MRLLLDEMISPRVARELRERGFDVQAIKKDRPELERTADREIVRRMAAEKRVVVTNDVLDYQPIHDRLIAAGEEHYGMVFTYDDTLPRGKGDVALWVHALEPFLVEHPAEDALRNQVHHVER